GAASGLESNRYAKQREEERLAEEKRREERDAYLAQYPRFTVKEINDMREPNPYKFEQEWLGKTILITGEFWIINYGRMGLKDDDFSSVWCNFSGENRNQLYEPKHKEGDKIRVLGTVAPGEFITLNNCSLE
ncbi:MAG: hypothetical protein LBQ38_01570, partial [Spirochaetaceae bacterium]|nr:hypothetical protein [Spirochaetaceae bacterium]